MSKADKPVVQYLPNAWNYVNVGQRASVYALNHPHLGADRISTSKVVSYDSNTGEFETQNTLYVPATAE